jgi:hypothetical protein
VIGVKLILFLYCWGLRHKSSQVHVLWEDHRNDLFINGFGACFLLDICLGIESACAGILMSAGGSKLAWWLDATGAIIVRTHFYRKVFRSLTVDCCARSPAESS